jgi:hypothetical protein
VPFTHPLFLSLLCTFYFSLFTAFSPAAAILPQLLLRHPPAAANTGNCCAKIAFFRFLPQLSSPSIADFSQNQSVKLKNLPNFSPFLTEGNACGTPILPFLTEGNVVVFVATIFP